MKIYRKRFIPNEIVDISGDEITLQDKERLITKWIPIKPRKDIAYGESCVYFRHGWKVSKFFDKEGHLKYWYCDIIQSEYFADEDKLVLTDLLLDVIVYSDGNYEILDEEELATALQEGLITEEIAKEAREKVSQLINVIKNGKFHEYQF